MSDPHRLLGLRPGASPDEIRAARRRLAKELHPDTVVDPHQRDLAQARMAEINRVADELLTAGPSTVASPPTSSTVPGRAAGRQAWANRAQEENWDPGDEASASFRIGGVDLHGGYELILLGLANLGDAKEFDSPRVVEAQIFDPVPCLARATLAESGNGVLCTIETAPLSGSRLPPPAPVILMNRLLRELQALAQ